MEHIPPSDHRTEHDRQLSSFAPDSLELRFIDTVEDFLPTAIELHRGGARTFVLRPECDQTAELAKQLADTCPDAAIRVQGAVAQDDKSNSADTPEDVEREPCVYLLVEQHAEKLDVLLNQYTDIEDGVIVAPTTIYHSKRRPVFLVSVPKSGTHLAITLLESFGYKPGGEAIEPLQGGYWYYALHSNAHTSAKNFFVHAVQRAPHGNRAHPLISSPVIFNYGHPLDILVSEANYYHIAGRTAFASYFADLDYDERVDRLIDDPLLLGSIRDRVLEFVPWLRMENVIPVSYEEMVGDAGGGSDHFQERLIWSLMLKLHVDGGPNGYAAMMAQGRGPTFRQGKIGASQAKGAIPERSLQRLRALPEDYITELGYPGLATWPEDRVIFPAHIDEFRRRPVRVPQESSRKDPILVEKDFLGYNLVSYGGLYYGLNVKEGQKDLGVIRSVHSEEPLKGTSISDVKARIIRACVAAEPDKSDGTTPILHESNYLGYNLVEFDGAFYAVRYRLGPLNLDKLDGERLKTFSNSKSLMGLKAKLLVTAAVEDNENKDAPGKLSPRLGRGSDAWRQRATPDGR